MGRVQGVMKEIEKKNWWNCGRVLEIPAGCGAFDVVFTAVVVGGMTSRL